MLTRYYFARLLLCIALAAILLGSQGTLRAAQAAPAATIVVNDGGDAGSCAIGIYTLRCAINYANANPNTYIRFATALSAVLLQSALPAITGDYTWIDGHDQSGDCACPRIDGAAMTTGSALTVNASFVTISNMKIVNVPSDGKDVLIVGGKDIEVSYSQLGILPGASGCAGPQSFAGVYVEADNSGGSGNDNATAYVIGNTLSCHSGSGVVVYQSSYVSVGVGRTGTVIGNRIGTTSDGLSAAGNAFNGVRIYQTSQVTIQGNLIAYNHYVGIYGDGNTVYITGNTVSGNETQGMWLGTGSALFITGNKVGTSADGLQPWPNKAEGIILDQGTGIYLSGNLEAYNGKAGVAVTGDTTHAVIQDDEIRNNGGLPIDLGNDGATPNGPQGLAGPNHWLAYPVVTSFSGSFLQGTTCSYCTVNFFKAVGNPAAPGGGGKYQSSVYADVNGVWSATLPNGLMRLDVTMTATNSSSDTSEMSPRGQLLLPLIRR